MYQRRFVLWDIVLFPTSDVKGVSTYKIPNYPHALSHSVCGDHVVLYLKKMRMAAYQVRFFSNKVEGFTTSRSLRVFYSYPPPAPLLSI